MMCSVCVLSVLRRSVLYYESHLIYGVNTHRMIEMCVCVCMCMYVCVCVCVFSYVSPLASTWAVHPSSSAGENTVMCFFIPACLNPRMADTIVGNSTNTCKESRGEKSTSTRFKVRTIEQSCTNGIFT